MVALGTRSLEQIVQDFPARQRKLEDLVWRLTVLSGVSTSQAGEGYPS